MKKIGFFLCLLCLVGCGLKDPGIGKFDVSYTTSENCWTCSLYIACFGSMGQLIDEIVQVLSKYGLKLLGVGLLFWMVFFILKTFSSGQQPDFKKFWPSLTVTLGKGILVAVLLSSSGEPLKYFVNQTLVPLLQIVLSFGNTVFFKSLGQSELLMGKGKFDFQQIMGSADMGDYLFFTRGLASGVTELIFRFNNLLSTGWELSRSCLDSARTNGNIAEGFVGLIVGGITFSLVITVPFMFIDGFIRIGGILLLLPILMVAWVFRETKKITIKALNILIGSIVQLFLTCVILGTFGVILLAWWKEHKGGSGDIAQLLEGIDFSQEGLGNMVLAMTRLMEGAMSQPLLLLLLFLFMQQAIKNIPNISLYFGGDGGESVFSSTISQMLETGKNALMAGNFLNFGSFFTNNIEQGLGAGVPTDEPEQASNIPRPLPEYPQEGVPGGGDGS